MARHCRLLPPLQAVDLLTSATLAAALLQEALFKAVKLPGRRKCVAAILTALDAGASLTATNRWGWTALHLAARYNPDTEAVAAAIKTLVEEGADVNGKCRGGDQGTALHLAVLNSNAAAAAAAIRALVAAGASCGSRDRDGDEAIHWITERHDAATVSAVLAALVAAGCNMNAKSSTDGVTPLVRLFTLEVV